MARTTRRFKRNIAVGGKRTRRNIRRNIAVGGKRTRRNIAVGGKRTRRNKKKTQMYGGVDPVLQQRALARRKEMERRKEVAEWEGAPGVRFPSPDAPLVGKGEGEGEGEAAAKAEAEAKAEADRKAAAEAEAEAAAKAAAEAEAAVKAEAEADRAKAAEAEKAKKAASGREMKPVAVDPRGFPDFPDDLKDVAANLRAATKPVVQPVLTGMGMLRRMPVPGIFKNKTAEEEEEEEKKEEGADPVAKATLESAMKSGIENERNMSGKDAAARRAAPALLTRVQRARQDLTDATTRARQAWSRGSKKAAAAAVENAKKELVEAEGEAKDNALRLRDIILRAQRIAENEKINLLKEGKLAEINTKKSEEHPISIEMSPETFLHGRLPAPPPDDIRKVWRAFLTARQRPPERYGLGLSSKEAVLEDYKRDIMDESQLQGWDGGLFGKHRAYGEDSILAEFLKAPISGSEGPKKSYSKLIELLEPSDKYLNMLFGLHENPSILERELVVAKNDYFDAVEKRNNLPKRNKSASEIAEAREREDAVVTEKKRIFDVRQEAFNRNRTGNIKREEHYEALSAGQGARAAYILLAAAEKAEREKRTHGERLRAGKSIYFTVDDAKRYNLPVEDRLIYKQIIQENPNLLAAMRGEAIDEGVRKLGRATRAIGLGPRAEYGGGTGKSTKTRRRKGGKRKTRRAVKGGKRTTRRHKKAGKGRRTRRR